VCGVDLLDLRRHHHLYRFRARNDVSRPLGYDRNGASTPTCFPDNMDSLDYSVFNGAG
jgi:hypothetical protein